jgi:tRNA A-37 threonylcarbamoyl transferase component Bud32
MDDRGVRGQRLAGYVLGDLLGEGGMGVVYAADQPVLGRSVAIKRLRPELADDPDMQRRFYTEARVGGRIRHPNLATVFDFGIDAHGVPYLVMERLSGELLGSVVAREGALTAHRATALVGQLLAGLGEAHAEGIVHGDVKSDNVVVERRRDGREQVKLIDFGLARIIAEPSEAPVADPMLSGTPEYLAPEVILGAEPRPASDVYAAGIVLYELLTGTTPFAGGTSAEILTRHLDEDVVPPSLRCPERDIPPALERVVLRALDKDPLERYADATRFARALAAVAPGPEADHASRAVASERRSAFSAEATTRSLGGDDLPAEAAVARPRLAAGTSPRRRPDPRGARRALLEAFERGDVGQLVAGYLELARALVDSHQLAAAADELEEAVDVLTHGGGPTADDAPESLWRVLLALAALYAGLGDARRARRAARAGRDHAARVGSRPGTQRAAELIHRLARVPSR